MELPEYLKQETEENIMQRMLKRISDDIDKTEGSYIWDALAPVAYEIAQMKKDMNEYLKRGFASTSFGRYLDLRCEEHGLKRGEAKKAVCKEKFTGKTGTLIPAGTIISTTIDEIADTQSVEFKTLSNAVISNEGRAFVDIEAVDPGSIGNVPAGAVNLMVTPINGIVSITNESAASGGKEIETDESLLRRYFNKVQLPSTSGNQADYYNWTMEVEGVGNAQIVPLWNGAGTVKVILLDDSMQPANPNIVNKVQEYLKPNDETKVGKAPIGASVTVVPAESIDINITAKVVLDGSRTLSEVQKDFETVLTNHLKNIAFSDDTKVRYSLLGTLLLDTNGITDYSNLLINNETGNIILNNGQVAVKGTVTLNE